MKNTKFLIPILFFLVSGKLFGQHTIGITYEPSLATNLEPNFVVETNPPTYLNRSGRFANSFGLDYIIGVGLKGHALKTGMYFIDNGYKEKMVQDDPLVERTDRVYQQYLSLPLEYYRSFDWFYFNAGPNINYSLARYRKLGTGTTTLYETGNHIVFGFKGEAGLNFRLRKNWTFNVGAFNRLFLGQGALMNYGLILGSKYSLKN